MCRNSGLQYGASACTSGIWCYSNDSYRCVGKYLVYIQSAGSWCSGICFVLSFCRSHKTCCCYIFYFILLLLFFDCCASAPDMLCPFPLLYIVSEFWAMFFRFNFLFSNLGWEDLIWYRNYCLKHVYSAHMETKSSCGDICTSSLWQQLGWQIANWKNKRKPVAPASSGQLK